VEIPEAKAGRRSFRVEGTYAARDCDVFECVESAHAEVFVVYRGFQFAIGWGRPENVRDTETVVAGFLARSTDSRGRIIGVLEKELALRGGYGAGDQGRGGALHELLEDLGWTRRIGNAKIRLVKLTSQE
jgi:hypothetical protein